MFKYTRLVRRFSRYPLLATTAYRNHEQISPFGSNGGIHHFGQYMRMAKRSNLLLDLAFGCKKGRARFYTFPSGARSQSWSSVSN